MKNFFNYVLASMLGTILVIILVALVNIFIFLSIVSLSENFAEKKAKLSENSVITLSLDDESIADKPKVKFDFGSFKLQKTISLKDAVDALSKAKSDPKIKGVYLDLSLLSAMNTGLASLEEIRNALTDFKTSGKFILAHSDIYTHKSYYLATAADELYLTPTGNIQFTGLSAQLMFFKSLLEKAGIQPEIIRHGKYKSAVEPFMSNEMSEANREQTHKYLSSLWETMLKGISKARNISVADLNKYADELALNDSEAAEKLHFIDGQKYEDEIIAILKSKVSDDYNKISLADYIKSTKDIAETLKTQEKNIAIVYAEGEIVDGAGTNEQIGSETLAEAIREAREDESVNAIVLRVNSPGGSALASEVIWREATLAKQTKPLIVSMGNVAASGGYYISCNADKIVAEPTTITGSIGVFGILFNAKELMSDIGISINTVNTNTYSDIGSLGRKMSSYERESIQKGVESIYSTFITRVGKGRNLPIDSVDAIGQGRVWSGEDALKIGLVDTLGGLKEALDIAAKKANITDFGIKCYPEKDKFTQITETLLYETKQSFVKNEMGRAYPYYKNIQKLKNISGIQARLPYYSDIK